MFASLLIAAALSSNPHDKVTVANLRSGLACTSGSPSKGQDGWICQPTDLILVTDNGNCVYDGKKELCTWHGFEFDYSASRPGLKLQCTWRSDRPADDGNPEKVKAKATNSIHYELELPEKSGHLFNPQYHIFQVRPMGDADSIEDTECSYRKLPRQAGSSKVEFLARWWRYSMGVMPPSESWGRCSL